MKHLDRLRLRLSLALKGPKAVGETYRPVLSSIDASGVQICTSVRPVLTQLGLNHGASDSQDDGPPVLDRSVRIFPDFYDSDDQTRECIWRVITHIRPECVVETGVANGLSSQTILSALEVNGRGSLFSFDIDSRTRESVPVHLRHRWNFKLLNRKSAKRDLSTEVTPLIGKIGVWFHDSDHSYSWQRDEFALAAHLLAPGGILISDDADGTEAFADFCQDHPDWSATALFDTRKVCGFARKPGT